MNVFKHLTQSLNRDDLMIAELELRQLFQRDPERAWRKFLQDYTPQLYVAIKGGYRCIGVPHPDEDQVDEAYTLVLERLSQDDYRRLREFRGESQLNTWLTTICRRVCIDQQRKASKRESIFQPLPAGDEMDNRNPFEPEDERRAEDSVLEDESRRHLAVIEATVDDCRRSCLSSLEQVIARLMGEGKKPRQIAPMVHLTSKDASRRKKVIERKLRVCVYQRLQLQGFTPQIIDDAIRG
jgi:RNA polymerase sigma factor (sigma-70 family)